MSKLILLLAACLLLISCSENEFEKTLTTEKSKSSTPSLEADSENINEQISNKVDILFVIDAKESMKQENNALGNGINDFIEELDSNNIDYNICYNISYVDAGGHEGDVRRWANGSSVITNRTPNAAKEFANTLYELEGYLNPAKVEPIRAVYHTLKKGNNSDCLRKNTPLEVIILSDTEQPTCSTNCDPVTGEVRKSAKLSENNNAQNLLSLTNQVKPESRLTIHTIIKHATQFSCFGEGNNKRSYLIEGSQLTGGTSGDICEPDQSAHLFRISQSILKNITR